MKTKWIIGTLILWGWSSGVFAYVPTVESLFRNGHNNEVSTNLVTLKMKIVEVEFESSPPAESEPATDPENEREKEKKAEKTKKEPKETYLQFSFFNPGEGARFLQLGFNSSSMNENSLVSYFYHPSFVSKFKSKKEGDPNKDIFYSVLFSLGLNQEGPMISFLGRINGNFVANQDLLNWDKLKALEKYKNYLAKIKASPSLKNTLESPLRPKSPEERREILKLMTQNVFKDSKVVKLLKEDNGFFWQVNLNNFKANFSDRDHQLAHLIFQDGGEEFRLDCYDYALIDGIHGFPRNWVIKTTNNRIYSLQVLDLGHSNVSADQFGQWAEKYKNVPSKDKKKENGSPKIDFLY